MTEFLAGPYCYWHWCLAWVFDVYHPNALIATVCSLADSIPSVYRVLVAGNLVVVTIYFSTGLQIIYCSELIDFDN